MIEGEGRMMTLNGGGSASLQPYTPVLLSEAAGQHVQVCYPVLSAAFQLKIFFTRVQSITVWRLTLSPKHQNVLTIWWNPFCSYFSLLMESECRLSATPSSVCRLVITAVLQTKHHCTRFLSFSPTLHSSASFIFIPSQYHAQILLPKDTSDRLHLSVYPAWSKQAELILGAVPPPASYTANFHHTLWITSESWIFILVQEIKIFLIRPGLIFFIHKMQIVGLWCQLQYATEADGDFMCQILKRPIPHLCLQEIFLALSLDRPETLHNTGKKS